MDEDVGEEEYVVGGWLAVVEEEDDTGGSVGLVFGAEEDGLTVGREERWESRRVAARSCVCGGRGGRDKEVVFVSTDGLGTVENGRKAGGSSSSSSSSAEERRVATGLVEVKRERREKTRLRDKGIKLSEDDEEDDDEGLEGSAGGEEGSGSGSGSGLNPE